MAWILGALLSVSILLSTEALKRDCPCDTPELCEPISHTPAKEVVGFVVNQDNWMRYNWTHLTTLMMFTPLSPDLMCHAHSKGVRIVLGGLNGFSLSNLTNSSARSTWIKEQLALVVTSHADGINLDIEDPVKNGSTEQTLLTLFVQEVYQTFKAANNNYQVSYDVAWSPNCTDGRCYQVDKFVDSTDFLIVMSYDEQSQIYGPCVASANSPLPKTELGIQQYLDLGISPGKLVLGQPWYGYDYPCIEFTSGNDVCSIKKVPFRGVPCSDAAGSQHDYGSIRQLIRDAQITVQWNDTLKAPFFQHQMMAGDMHQFWFDDPRSLSLKYSMAATQSLRGLAFWNVDALDYSDQPDGRKDTAEMWAAIDALFSTN